MHLWTIVTILVILSPVIAVAAATAFRRDGVDGVASAIGVAGSIALLTRVAVVGPVAVNGDWFVVDRVAAVWTVFALVVVFAIRTFARRLLAGDPQRRRFHVLGAIAASSGAALFCASNLLVMAGVAALSSLASAALIGSRDDGRRVAKRMAVVLLTGDALLLAATLIVVRQAGTSSPAALTLVDGASRTLVAALVVFAALVRCSQVPFHGWLPRTLVAPTPASALLHAGLVNAGGVILIRWAPLVSRSVVATLIGLALAISGLVLGAAVMRSRAEVKSNLVWSTTAQMGFMLVQVLVGLGPAAAAHLIAHGAYKSNRFLLSGSTLEHQRIPHAQQRTVDRLVAAIAACVLVGTAVAATRYNLDAHHGAALLIPAFAVLTVQSIIVGRIGGPTVSRGSWFRMIVAVFAATTAYLAFIEWFDSWLSLPIAVPGGAWLMVLGVVVVTVVAGSVLSGARSARSRLPATFVAAAQARVLAIARRPVLQAAPRQQGTGAI